MFNNVHNNIIFSYFIVAVLNHFITFPKVLTSVQTHENRIPMKKDRVELMKEGRKCLTTHSTHFIYGYMASDIW